MHNQKHIKSLSILDHSGFMPKPGSIPFAKKHQYFIVTDIAITGDSPKDFIRYYQYGTGRKADPNTWPWFIAKHGHKHYPMEAITEYTLPFTLNCETLKNVCSDEKFEKVINMIDKEFSQLMSYERRELIKICLRYRHDYMNKIFNFAT